MGYILPTMPKVSFYLRNEDLDAWKSIEKKTAWVHDRLRPGLVGTVQTIYVEPENSHNVPVENKDYVMSNITESADIGDMIPDTNPYGTKSYDLCKHNSVKGLCKMGCK